MIVAALILAYIAQAVAVAFWLRHIWAWAQRVNDCNWRLLTLLDEVAAYPLFAPLYAVGWYPRRPMVGDTISSLLWFGEISGARWCRPLRRAVDTLFRLLTSQRDHCRKAWLNWANPMAT